MGRGTASRWAAGEGGKAYAMQACGEEAGLRVRARLVRCSIGSLSWPTRAVRAAQGVGGPCCARILTTWFASKERGTYWGM